MRKLNNFFDDFLPNNIIVNLSDTKEFEKVEYSLNHFQFPYNNIFDKRCIKLYHKIKNYLRLTRAQYDRFK